MSLLSLSPTTSSSPSSLPNYAGPHQPAPNPHPPSSSSRRPPPSSFAASGSSGPNRPGQRIVPTIEKEKDLGRRRRLAASMLGPSASIREEERGGSSVERGEMSRGEGRGGKDVGAWVAGVEKGALPRVPSEGEVLEGKGESGGRKGEKTTTTREREEATAVSDLRSLLEKALSEVGSSENIPPAITPPLFPPPSTSNLHQPTPQAHPQPQLHRSRSSSSVESADDEEDWLVVRPRAERDATRTTNKFLELGWKDGNISLNSTTSSGLVETDSTNGQPSTATVPRRLFPQRASTEPTSSNRPLPPLPPPPYLAADTSSPSQDGDDAYTFKASLFAGLDAKTKNDDLLSSPPPPPFRSHSSPPNTSAGAASAASSSSASPNARDQDEERGGEGSGTAGRGAAKLRSLFFAGKLGGGRKKEEIGMEYRRASAGKGSGVESERQTHRTSSLLPSSLNLNPFRRSSSPSSFSQGSTITPYTYGVAPSTPAPTPAPDEISLALSDDAFDLPLPPNPSTPPVVSRLAGGSSSGAYLTHGEISRRLEEMEDDESRRVGELWLV